MKTLTFTHFILGMGALILLALLMAMPASAKVIAGCEVVQADNGNYFYKVDPTCAFERDGLGDRGEGKENLVNFQDE